MTYNQKFWPPKRADRSGLSKAPEFVGHGIEVFKKNGIWKVTLDGKFRGDYHQEEHALAAAALLDRPRR
ncbi:hypothetical protein [Roseivivax lentus]|uniref:hypothetical protein n=1 Tax=Roseivivax lentus TaxID=633194 RepID=UPI00117B17B6|nr:hypothetical protein [Roseivivax lentus]